MSNHVPTVTEAACAPAKCAAKPAASRSKRLDKDGVPVDQNDWTEADWLDLHNTMKRLKRRVAARHRVAPE